MTSQTILPQDQDLKTQPIAVAEKIIADVSTGIYRTPAAALKELIANAYDADATEVRIETGIPNFEQLVIKDNGSGMSIDRFLQIITHIGGSWKRIDNPEGVTPIYKRPLIGRIGIGLLAVAQLGQRFYVSSSQRGVPTRFLAEIDLTPFHKDDAAMRSMSDTDSNEKINIGMIRYVDALPEPVNSHFTVITVPDPKKGLISEMYSQLRHLVNSETEFSLEERAKTFKDIVDIVQSRKRADLVLDGYHLLVWELGLLSPVEYLDGGPFDPTMRSVENFETASFDNPQHFKVILDGLDVRRPIRFPNPSAVKYGGPAPIIYRLEYNQVIAGRLLSFTGYIYSQKPHIDPLELQGIQIRIRSVGIGAYDRTWMGYPFDEGIKFGQITGEVYVHEGLESALNIDRASFRETDPHYLALRAYIWQFLQKRVFPDSKQRQKKTRSEKDAAAAASGKQKLAAALASAPDTVGTSPRVENNDSDDEDEPLFKGLKPDPKSSPGKNQSIVSIVDGEVVIPKKLISKLRTENDLSKTEELTLLKVSVVLASYGLWEQLTQESAHDLLNALAVAIHQ